MAKERRQRAKGDSPHTVFVAITRDMMREQGITSAYRLAQLACEAGHEVTAQTVRNFLAGKPVKTDTLAAIFSVLKIKASGEKGAK